MDGDIPTAIVGTPDGFLGYVAKEAGIRTVSSVDGLTWRRGAELVEPPSGFLPDSRIDLLRGPGGYVLAIPVQGSVMSGRYWLSDDGLSWDLLAADVGDGHLLFRIAADQDALYAVTFRGDDRSDSALWRSLDGRTWNRSLDAEQLPGAPSGRRYVIYGAAASAGRVLAYGVEDWVLGDEGTQGLGRSA